MRAKVKKSLIPVAANKALETTNNDIYDLLSSINLPIVMVGRDLRIRRITAAAEKVFHMVPSVVGRPLTDIKPIMNVIDTKQLITDVMDQLKTIEREVQDQDGHWHNMLIKPYRTEDDQTDGAVIVLIDFDLTKCCSQIIKEEEDKLFESIVNQSPQAIILTDQEHKIVLVNLQAEKLFGYSKSELIGQNILLLVPIPHRQQHAQYQAEYIKNPQVRPTSGGRELVALRKDGFQIPVEIGLTPIKIRGEILILSTIVDITERKSANENLKKLYEVTEKAAAMEREKNKQLEETYHQLATSQARILHIEKLAGIGQLAAGVSHELNSPLAGLLTLLRAYRKETDKNSPKFQELTIMTEAAEHMASVISDLNAFAKTTHSKFTRINVNKVIEATLNFSMNQFQKNDIKLIEELDPELLMINGDKAHLQQVILNMITNACDAMPNGGTFVIKTRNSQDRREVMVDFIDNGVGISKENITKIFEPFFTTKGDEKGMGIGLFVSHGIIETHHGSIAVESQLGQGTKFTITLPAMEKD